MKKLILSLTLLSGAFLWTQAQKVSILGDSYSTYGGYVYPEYNLCWYNGTDGGANSGTDVTDVSYMWWSKLCDATGLEIDTNNSYSGSTVCLTGYGQRDFSDRAFITRLLNIGNPDIIIIFGGTNDSWAHSPIGDYRYGGWTKKDMYAFRPAFAYMLSELQSLYPGAEIYTVTNSDLSPEITESIAGIAEHYGVTNIQLHDIEKIAGHPSIKGMQAISDQLQSVIKPD